uniref:Sodefrin-like factor F n=1 Tax=Hyloscirtus phyllognathus TaxID=371702 RepID=A0A513ZV73_9NEOB|nr:sodefrin precursor-like factor F [Hyloscirtus phyllognathus]
MKYLVVFLVFAMAEITIGEAIRCLQCKADGKSDCSGRSVTCPNKRDFCAKTVEENIANGKLIRTVSRRCLNESEACDKVTVATSTEYLLSLYNECCYKNNCNKGPIKMPKKKTRRNGYYCPSCFTVESNTCTGEHKQLPCTGNQRDCFVFIGKATLPGESEMEFYNAGCITKGACDYIVTSVVGTEVDKANSIIWCSSAHRERILRAMRGWGA